MPLSKATAGMALWAAGAGTVLSHGLLPLLKQGAVAGPGTSFALVRYEGFLGIAVAQLLCLAFAAGIVRMGSSKSIGPNAQLAIFHDGNALVGTALAIALHGSGAAWPLAFLCAGRLLVGACQALKLRSSVSCAAVWAFAGAALLLNNAGEGAGAAFWCQCLLGAGGSIAGAALPLAQALDRFAGIAPMHYTVGVAFRYTLMRYISWALDTLTGSIHAATHPMAVAPACSEGTDSPRIAAVGGGSAAAANGTFDHLAMLSGPDSPQKVHPPSTAALASSSWSAYLSYSLFAPTYLAGPILPAADFFRQAAAASAGRHATSSLAGGAAWWRSVARLAGFVAFVEALRRTFFSDNMVQALLAAQPWQAWGVGYCLLTALFAQSFVPWTFARLGAGLLGIAAIDEAPVGFLRSSLTPRTFWRSFHVSWYRWVSQYVYIPLGGSTAAVFASLAVSTLLHGAQWAWLTWGAIQCAALLVERHLAAASWPTRLRLHPHLATALVQCATQATLLVQLPLGPSLPAFMLCFQAVNLPFCILNAARLAGRRQGTDHGGGQSGLTQRRKQKLAWE